jgi:tripartite-type tricarboxylate transporter receptor subunit TctC
MKTFMRWMLGAFALTVFASTSVLAADPYPSRPIRIIVNTGAGGLTDVTTRLIGQKMSEILKQPVVVENRAGGDGLIGIRFVKSAPPDGYTLLASAGSIAFQTAV